MEGRSENRVLGDCTDHGPMKLALVVSVRESKSFLTIDLVTSYARDLRFIIWGPNTLFGLGRL